MPKDNAMKKGKLFSRGTGLIIAATIPAIVAISFAVHGIHAMTGEIPKPRADRIDIDALKVFGKLERQPVTFYHDKHTDAVAKQNKDCKVCHLSENNRQSLKYMRLKDDSKSAVMDIYHVQCIGCHSETRAAKQKSGPVTCGGCHNDEDAIASSWQPIGMDKSLHYRHVKAHNNKCDSCHHEYDASQKKLIYVKGKEGSCRYCHRQQTEENRIALQLASHTACIECHRQKLAATQLAGPVECSGCHDAAEQKLIEVVKNVPRMERNQPDVVLVKQQAKAQNPTGADSKAKMNLVPFNHKAHEQYNNSCRVCHHADLNACVSCHTNPGIKKGNFIKLEQAMHQLGVQQSCVGCHQSFQQEPACAGCHVSIESSRSLNPATCSVCHMSPLPENGNPEAASDPAKTAARLLDSRKKVSTTFQDKDVPEIVTIKTIADQYQPVAMPHRRIVSKLAKEMQGNDMANYFHANEAVLCQGCHHHSPASKTPPKCSSCHGVPFESAHPSRPGLLGAYHQQCMDCHKAMRLPKPIATDCEGCHKKK